MYKAVHCWQAYTRYNRTLKTAHARNTDTSTEFKQHTQYCQELFFSTLYSQSTLKNI